MKTKLPALIIDDEPDLLALLGLTLKKMNVPHVKAASCAEARAALASGDFCMCLTDLRLPDGSGMDLIKDMQQSHPDMPVAMITAYGSMDLAVEALKKGAFDCVSKPLQLDEVRALIRQALNLGQRQTGTTDSPLDSLIGDSAAMQTLKKRIEQAARSQAPVCMTGESGTGKERVAQTLHQLSSRRDGPFVAVNCGAIPSELVESELFGHIKGSFTGAHCDKPGLFQEASGGTLFLDEVAELPLNAQVKLLRVLQEKKIRPVGHPSEIPVDVRVLCASHKHLNNEVRDGRFRQDLYFRLNVIAVHVPALRERLEDLPALVDHFLGRMSQRDGRSRCPEISPAALDALRAHRFPGNVRELENILERALAMQETESLEASDMHLDDSTCLEPDLQDTTASATPMTIGQVDLRQVEGDLESYLAKIEKDILEQALTACRWNRTKAADQLGLTPRQMRYKLDKYNLN